MHSVLERQLRKCGLSEATLPETAEGWSAFLKRVAQSYGNADQERSRVERSLVLSADEMQEFHGRQAGERDTLRAILGATGEGILGVDRDGGIRFINAAAERLTGYTEQEAIGHVVHDLLHHSHLDGSPYPADTCGMVAALASGEPGSRPDEFLWRKDGTSFPIECTIVPVADRGQLVRNVLTFNDVSERKDAEAALRVRDRAIAAATSPLVITDARSAKVEIVYANPAFERLTGYSQAELVGCSIRLLEGAESDPTTVAEIRRALAEGGEAEATLVSYRKDGSWFWNEVAIAPVRR
jgi:PAS domain S-box-containing protein